MGKRKQKAPQRATEEKRTCLTWNMLDGDNRGSVSVIPDNDPSLHKEATQSKQQHALHEHNENTPPKSEHITEVFDLYVENSLFNILVHRKAIIKDGAWRCVLAEFSVKFSEESTIHSPPNELPDTDFFTLHISHEKDRCIFSNNCGQKLSTPNKKKSKVITTASNVKFWLVNIDIPFECLQALMCRNFQVVLDRFDADSMTMGMKIIGTESVLARLSCPSEAIRLKGVNQSLCVLMDHFYKISAPDLEDLPYSRKHDIDEIYATIKHRHTLDLRPILSGVQHEDLLPTLRLYQQAAITWMLYKEKHRVTCTDSVHMLYTEIITKDGQTLYYNKYGGVLIRDRPIWSVSSPGGILGDEMGLGKTVEVLGCILHHPRSCIPLPPALPIIQDEEIPPKKRKSRKRRSKDEVETILNDESDTDTIIYSGDQSIKETQDTGKMLSLNCVLKDENVNDKDIGAIRSETQSTDISEIKTKGGKVDNCDNVEDENDSAFAELEKVESENLVDEVEEKHPCKSVFAVKRVCQKEEFACICGDMGFYMKRLSKKRKHAVQCVICRLWQHAECVNYDLTDQLRGEFKCPHCHIASRPIASGATLIISPSSIAHQWVDEILKHVSKKSLNVMMYEGVNKQGFIQPQTLARQDIVITTYETLRKELDYVDLPHSNSDSGRKLRHPKRFMALPSPIIAVEWWRICLDEAQMVECTTTKTAEMALRLTAVNRWCVTGTPIQKGIDDLYGLMLFLGVDPYWVLQWWKKLVYDPFCHGVREPMYDLLTSVLWRTVKDDVLDQINIPAQSEHLQWLTFSPVEEHFYRKQHGDCVRLSMERLSKWTDSSIKLSSLDRHTVNQLLYPLVRLRQACCHPQAVRGEFIAIQKSTMTMEELLESLTKKARLEAEESHRAYVAAINGEAGLHIINDEYIEAVEKYREVLRSVEEHKERLHTDSLQQLHAMYNLHEVLTAKPQGIAPTLRDDFLKTQIAELKDKYLSKAVAFVKSTEEALAPVQVDVKRFQRELNDGSEWWIDVIQYSVSIQQDDSLILKVRDDLKENRDASKGDVLLRSCRDTNGLLYAVENRLSKLHKAYTVVLKALQDLQGVPNQDLINKTVECCLRPDDEILATCPFCKCEELLQAYETRLFLTVDKGIEQGMSGAGTQVNTQRQGTWADSDLERALKSILNFAKSYRVAPELVEFGTSHIKLFDAWKKEFKRLRMNWAGIKEHVGAFDEIDMCTTRLRLRLPDEPVPETPQPNILEKTELAQHKLKLASDRIVALGEMRKKLGQLLYLTNLAKAQDDNKSKDNPELCPICQIELGTRWSVMQCGHCYCLECIRILAERAAFGRRNFTVKCAICRESTHNSEISYVSTKQEQDVENADIRVVGSHSTKVEAIVRCLLKIKKDYPSSKSLVFSTWTDVLSVIARALEENDISYRALYAAGKFQQNLSAFKQEDDVSALLLPVHSGANGLNLIEATHVLLVEPILNPAQELQAIGRVHRIGQTKPTHVYRFLVRGTIEQKMQMLVKSLDTKNTATNIEESALTIGDLSSLFSQQLEEENREGVSSTDEAETPGTSGETNNSGSSEDIDTACILRDMETQGTSRDIETPGSSRHDESLGASKVIESSGMSKDMDTAGIYRDIEIIGTSKDIETAGTSCDMETSGISNGIESAHTSGDTETEGFFGDTETASTARVIKSLCTSREMKTPVLSRNIETLVTSIDTKIQSRSEDIESPGTSRDIDSLGTSKEIETPSTSTDIKTQGTSFDMETSSTSRDIDKSKNMDAIFISMDIKTIGTSKDMDTPNVSKESETPFSSGNMKAPDSSIEGENPDCCIGLVYSRESETPKSFGVNIIESSGGVITTGSSGDIHRTVIDKQSDEVDGDQSAEGAEESLCNFVEATAPGFSGDADTRMKEK